MGLDASKYFQGDSFTTFNSLLNNEKGYKKLWPKEPTEEQYNWALSIVRSKHINIMEGFVLQPSLVPFFDMFRHTPLFPNESKMYEFDAEDMKLKVRANKEINPGDEVCVSE
jgi:hypothetical protein